MTKCSKCNYQMEEDEKYCLNCGTKIEDMKFNFDFPQIDYTNKNEIKNSIKTDIFDKKDEEEIKKEKRKRWLEEQKKIRLDLKTLEEKEENLGMLKEKINNWKNQGFTVTKLEDVIYQKEISELKRLFGAFDEDVQILKEIEAKLERLDTTGFEDIVEQIKSSLNDTESKNTILEQVMMLEEKIKDRKIKNKKYLKKIEIWKNGGYKTETLEKNMQEGIDGFHEEYLNFEKKVQNLKDLEKVVLEFEKKGFNIDEIKEKLKDIFEIEFINQKIIEYQKQEKDMGPWYLIGRDLYELGNFKDAIKYFDKALQKDPNNELIQKIRNICYEKTGRFEGKIEISDDKSIESIEDLYSKGVDLGSLGNYEEAIKYFEKVIELNPNHEKAWFNKGWAYEDLNRFEDSLECYNNIIEINPKNMEAWYNKGYVLQSLNRNEEALSLFDEVLKIEPNNADIYANKGTILGKYGRFYDAFECFEKATEINPYNADFWNKLAMVLYKLKRIEEALDSCNKALEIDHENQIAKKGKAMCLKLLNST